MKRGEHKFMNRLKKTLIELMKDFPQVMDLLFPGTRSFNIACLLNNKNGIPNVKKKHTIMHDLSTDTNMTKKLSRQP